FGFPSLEGALDHAAVARFAACVVARIRQLELALSLGVGHGWWMKQHTWITIVATRCALNAIVPTVRRKHPAAIKPPRGHCRRCCSEDCPNGRGEIPNRREEVPNAREEVPNAREEHPNGRGEHPNARAEHPNAREELPNAREE